MRTRIKLTDLEVDKKVRLVYTQYDRKRKLSDRNIATIQRLLTKGKRTVAQLAKKYHVTEHTIRYNTDPEYRQHALDIRDGKHYGEGHVTVENRIAYKRKLLKNRTYLRKVGVRG